MNNLEVLISTMNRNNFFLVEEMNINSNALIINQSNSENHENKIYKGNKIRMLYSKERGLSKSRNLAIENSKAEICIIADDDLIYDDNYVQIIEETYKKNPNFDIIIFNVPSTNKERKTNYFKEGKLNFFNSLKVSSFQITFRRKKILKSGIKFNENFGAGSGKYLCGEENIFLIDCLKKKLKIKSVDEKIAIVNHKDSTWYQGFSKNLFKTKGAFSYCIFGDFWWIFILQFAIRKNRFYKKRVNFINALKYMNQGKNEYKKLGNCYEKKD